MTKVAINPGICKLITTVEASTEDDMEVILKVSSSCDAITNMMNELGDTFDAYELCLKKPGEGDLYQYASKHFPAHASCPAIAGIIKCAEVECKLALPSNAQIKFI